MSQRKSFPSLASLILPLLLACTAAPSGGGSSPPPSGTGGSTSTGGKSGSGGSGGQPGGSGGSASGGSTGSGGSASGGSTGSGGDSSATGGSSGTGGTTGGSDAAPASDAPGSNMPPEKGELGGQNFPGWKYVKPIVLDTSAAGANVTGAVMNFPVVVRLDAMNFDFAQARPNGEDIRFGGSDGTPLQYERELYDGAAKTAAFWVKVPAVAGGNATQSINIYWGNATAGDASDSTKVFDAAGGYVGVWHLGDNAPTAAGGYKDSTASGAHATGVNLDPMTNATAVIGNGLLLANAKEQWAKVEDKATLFRLKPDQTMSIWGKANSFPGRSGPGGYDTIYSKGEEWVVQKFSNSRTFETCFDGGNGGCAVGKTAIATGQWYRFTVVVRGGQASFYINGARDAGSGASSKDRAKPLAIGNQSQYIGLPKEKRSWDGYLDEALYIGAARDDNWVKLDYESQRPDSKFLKFGTTMMR
jgi:biopolymer transport protein ExbB